MVRRGDNVTFPGLLRPDEVRDQFGLEVPEDSRYETVGGYVMVLLGRLPAQGDLVEVPGGELEVVRMEGRRIDRLRFVPSPVDDESEAPS